MMRSPLKLTVSQAIEIIDGMKGEFVWGARIGPDNVLRMDFGIPFLLVREPQNNLDSVDDLSESAKIALRRRIVLPTGKWHLFVEDGFWDIKTNYICYMREDVDSIDKDRCLTQLDGQKFESISWIEEKLEWQLSFDLGGILTIKSKTHLGLVDLLMDSEWTLFFDKNFHISCVRDDIIVLG